MFKLYTTNIATDFNLKFKKKKTLKTWLTY